MGILQVRIEDELKQSAQAVYEQLGIDLSTAVRMFLKKSVMVNGIPFDMTVTTPKQEEPAEPIEKEEIVEAVEDKIEVIPAAEEPAPIIDVTPVEAETVEESGNIGKDTTMDELIAAIEAEKQEIRRNEELIAEVFNEGIVEEDENDERILDLSFDEISDIIEQARIDRNRGENE